MSGYADGGDAPDKQLSLVPGAVEEALASLENHPGTRARFDRVEQLVDGFETAFGLELLATVHAVMHDNPQADAPAIEQATYDWGLRKRQFMPGQIHLAAQRLVAQGWAGAGYGP